MSRPMTGAQLKRARLRLDLSQSQLATALGMKQPSLSYLEGKDDAVPPLIARIVRDDVILKRLLNDPP